MTRKIGSSVNYLCENQMNLLGNVVTRSRRISEFSSRSKYSTDSSDGGLRSQGFYFRVTGRMTDSVRYSKLNPPVCTVCVCVRERQKENSKERRRERGTDGNEINVSLWARCSLAAIVPVKTQSIICTRMKYPTLHIVCACECVCVCMCLVDSPYNNKLRAYAVILVV